jgi:hypothetical protein
MSPAAPHAFKAQVLEFTEALAAQKGMRKRVADARAAILQYMREHNVDEVDLGDHGRLVRKRTTRTQALKKEHIEAELRHLVGSTAAVDDAVSNIFGRRKAGEAETLALVPKARPSAE